MNKGKHMNVTMDPLLTELSHYSLMETLLAYIGTVGSTTAVFSFLMFLVWSVFKVVRFFGKIIKA